MKQNMKEKVLTKEGSTSSKDEKQTEEVSKPSKVSVVESTKKKQLIENTEKTNKKEGETAAGNEQSTSTGEQVDTIQPLSSTSVEVNDSEKSIDSKVLDIPVRKDDSTGKSSKDSDSISTATSTRDWGMNRLERRNKKTMRKLGMKMVLGVTRATFKTTKQGIFYIENPDVYRQKDGHQSIVIFGQTYRQDLDDAESTTASHNLQSVERAAEEFDISNIAAVEENFEEGEMCEDGLKQDDIEVVVSQALCSRSEAVVALRKNDGDLVNAIMELTT